MKKISILTALLLVISLLPQSVFAETADSLAVWGGFGRADNVYSHAVTDDKLIALTFDDGPHPKRTDEILDILAEYGVKATFFVIGKNAKSYPEKLKRICREGHEIGNHTYSHISSNNATKLKFKDELRRTDDIIFDITGVRPTLFRPPTGYCNLMTVQIAAELKYKIIVWTVDTRDWAHNGEKSIVDTVTSHAKSGDIVLFHDFISGDSPTPFALRKIIPALLSKGYSFVTVSELIASE